MASAQVQSGPVEQTVSGPAVVDNTARFFPQIDETIKARPITPENPKMPFNLPLGPDNNLKSGGLSKDPLGVPGARFPGISFTNGYPPDPSIGVGPNHIVQTVNGAIAFFDKTGTKLFQQSDSNSAFWSGLSATSFIFDPKVFYDHIAQRFVICELEQQDSGQISKLLVAVSDDSNPNGTWFKYRIEAKATIGSTPCWFDYPGWGYNKDGYVACGNYFPFTSGSSGARAIVLKKAPLLTGGSATVSSFDLSSFSVQTTRTIDSTGPNSAFCYGVGRNTSTTLRVYAWGGLDTDTPTQTSSTVTVPSYGAFNTNAPSAGGKQVDSLGDRMISTMIRDGKLVCAHTVRIPSETTRCQVSWYEVNVGTWPTSGALSLAQSGDVALPSGIYAIVPGIAKNKAGDISIIFTRSSSSIAADSMMVSRKSTDTAGTMSAPTLLASSAGQQTNSITRFGDYATVEIDPSDDLTFWGVVNTFGASNSWTTEISSWTVSSPSTPLTPATATVFFGNLVGGNASSAGTSDDVYYEVDSKLNGTAGQYAIQQLSFNSPVAPAGVNKLAVSVEAIKSGGGGVTGTIFLFNNVTGAWDPFTTYTLPTSGNATKTFTITTGSSKYVNGANQVLMLVRSIEPKSRVLGNPAVHRLKLDRAVVTIN